VAKCEDCISKGFYDPLNNREKHDNLFPLTTLKLYFFVAINDTPCLQPGGVVSSEMLVLQMVDDVISLYPRWLGFQLRRIVNKDDYSRHGGLMACACLRLHDVSELFCV